MQILRIFPTILLQLRIDGRWPLNTRFYSILLWIFCISAFSLPPSLVSLIQRRSFLSPLRRRIMGRQNSRLGGTLRFSFDTSRLVGRASGLYKCKSIKLATKLRLLSKKPPSKNNRRGPDFESAGKLKVLCRRGGVCF